MKTGQRQLHHRREEPARDLHPLPDGRRLAYSGTARNGTDTDVYLAEVASPSTARRLTEEPGTWLPVAFSPDGARLLVKQ